MLITNAGTWMESTATGWLVTDLEPDRASLWIGVISASFAIPMLLFPPLGGAVADRYARLRILWIVQIAYLILSASLAAVTLAGHVEIWMLILYGFLNGAVLAFDAPVRHALLPEIVTRDQLMSGVSLNSVAFTGAALVGPAVAGVLIPLIGVGGVMTVNAISCLATLYALWQMRDVPAHRPAPHGVEGLVRSIVRGVRYIRSSSLLCGLILVSTVSGLFIRSYSPLLAVFARDEYRVGSAAYGALVSAGGLGTLIGAFGLAGRREVTHRGPLVGAAVLSQAVLLIVFAATPWFGAALPLLLLVGAMNAVAGASIATLIQLSVPGELRGRVMSIYMLTVIGVPSVGAFVLGVLAVPLGVRGAVGLGGAIVIVAVSALFVRNGSLREAD